LTHDRIVPTVSEMTDQFNFHALGLRCMFALMTTAAWLRAAAFDLPSEVAKQKPLHET